MRRIGSAVAVLSVAIGCEVDLDAAFTRQIEARRLAADMRIQLHRSSEAVQRAIIADTDERSAEFAQEAQQATAALDADLRAIEPIAAELPDAARRPLEEFAVAFAQLHELDRDLLALAAENSNAKAQRLSFGPAREAADALRDALERAGRSAPAAQALRAQLLAARVQLGVREIQALQAPHIAEPEDGAMTQLEQRMSESEAAARAALEELSALLGRGAGQDLAAAGEQLDRFAQVHRELVALSRQNTDVRSLAVALGEKRALTATCDAALSALQDELAKDASRATR